MAYAHADIASDPAQLNAALIAHQQDYSEASHSRLYNAAGDPLDGTSHPGLVRDQSASMAGLDVKNCFALRVRSDVADDGVA